MAAASPRAASPRAAPPGLGEEDFPGFSADVCPAELPDLSKHHSALADVLVESPGLYGTLKDRKTSAGVGLARCIKVGIDNRGHRLVKTVGMVAGDEECFETFRDLVDPVLQRHLGDAVAGGGAAPGSTQRPLRHPQSSMPGLLEQRGLTMASMDVTGRYVVSTQVNTWRCLRGFRFTPAMSAEERCEVERLVARACSKLPERFQGVYLPLKGSQSYAPRPGGMDGLEAASLASDGLLFEAPDSTLRLCSGNGRHWPTARGVFASRDRSFSVWVNNQEHVRVSAKGLGADLQSVYKQLAAGLESLSQAMAGRETRQVFACSDRLGVLSSNLANLGTAMQVSIVIRLPGLAKHPGSGGGGEGAKTWRSWCADQRVNVTVAEARNQFDNDLFELSNSDRLGFSEVHIHNLLVEVVSRLVQMEQRLECGHSIDDLLEQDVEVVVPESIDKLALKAQATLLHGLSTGDLFSALTAARPGAAAAAAAAAAAEAEASAEAVLQSHVRPAAPQASLDRAPAEAELVRSAVSPQLVASAGSRPDTSGSVWTLHASSEVSVNGQAAQDLVMTLMEEGVEVAATPPLPEASKTNLSELRSKVGTMLFQACDDGRLETILNDVKTRAAAAPTPKAPQATTKAAAHDIDDLRRRAAGVLMDCSYNGRLEQALLDTKAEMLAAQQAQAQAQAPGGVQSVAREDLRLRLADSLISNLESGRLEAAARDVFGSRPHSRGQPKAAGTAAPPAARGDFRSMPQASWAALHARFGGAGGAGGGRGRGPAAAEEAPRPAPAQAAPPPQASAAALAGAPPPPPQRHAKSATAAVALIFKAVSTRDRRIGELTARIRETEVRLVQEDENLGKMEDMLSAAKQDLAHLELDIEWHRCALEGADTRRVELQACLKDGQRKLMLELDAQAQKMRQHDLEAGPSMMSARSELSTATGGTLQSFGGAYSTMATPRPPAGTVLEPLARRPSDGRR